MFNCNKPIVQDITEVPVDSLEQLPEYFLAERDMLDSKTGLTKRSLVRVPTATIFPNVNTDNLFSLVANNTAITVPEKQVRACYIENQVSSNVVQFADATHAPMFLVLERLDSGLLVCQNSGVVNMAEGHEYIVGAQYYVSDNGEPTTDNTSGKKLFIPISETKLLINLG